jgi:hypothetical protein
VDAPRILVFRLDMLMRGTSLLGREGLKIERLDSEPALIAALREPGWSAALINLEISLDLASISAAVQPAAAGSRLVLVCPKDPAKADRGHRIPDATVVAGPGQIRRKVLAAVSRLAAMPLRRPGPRLDVNLPAQLVLSGTAHPGRLMNLSAVGARVEGSFAHHPHGSAGVLRVSLAQGEAELAVRIVRHFQSPSGSGLAVSFDNPLSVSQLQTWLDPVAHPVRQKGPPREHPRVQVPRSLAVTVRMRRQGEKRVSYLRVVDLSEGGFFARAKGYQPGFQVGEVLLAELIAGPSSVACEVQAVHSTNPQSFGFRFRALSVAAAEGLQAVLERTNATGLRGASATAKEP